MYLMRLHCVTDSQNLMQLEEILTWAVAESSPNGILVSKKYF